jgi:hypothetical protein
LQISEDFKFGQKASWLAAKSLPQQQNGGLSQTVFSFSQIAIKKIENRD